MKFSHKITSAVLALSLFPMGLSVYADMGDNNDSPNDEYTNRRASLMRALDNADYDSWSDLAGPQMKQVVDRENFSQLVKAHELMQSGDIEDAQKIFDELGLQRLGGRKNSNMGSQNGQFNGQRSGNMKGKMHTQNGDFAPGHTKAMLEALDNADYDAWVKVAPEVAKEKINEDNFDRLVEAHNLVKSGDFEGAKTIFEDLGLDRIANAMSNKVNRAAMLEALDNNDYEAFLDAAPDFLKDKVTEDNFDRFVEAHNLIQEGDREGARAILDELGIRAPKRAPGERVGQRMGQGNGTGNNGTMGNNQGMKNGQGMMAN